MKKVIIFILLVLLILILNCNFKDKYVFNSFPGNRVIIVDAGHGGIDGGAIGNSGVLEKDINLEISKKLKSYIEADGDTSILIREVDEGLYSEQGSIRNKKNEDLKNRKSIIEETNGDVFVSIHLNSFTDARYYGAQVFYEKNDKSSEKLAVCVQNSMKEILDKTNKRVAKASDTYFILGENKIPSIIVECGFLTNNTEERLLKEELYQNKIAWSIYVGILKYLNNECKEVK